MPDKPKLYANIREGDDNFPLQVIGSAEKLPEGQSLGAFINEKVGFRPAGMGSGQQSEVYPIHRDRVASLGEHFDIELRDLPRQSTTATEELLRKLGIEPGSGGKAK